MGTVKLISLFLVFLISVSLNAATNVVSSTNTIKYARGTNDYYLVNGTTLPAGIPVNRSTTTAYYFEGIVTVKAGIILTPPARSNSVEYTVPLYVQDEGWTGVYPPGGVILFNFEDYFLSSGLKYYYDTANYGDKIAVKGTVAYDDYYVGATQIFWTAVLISSPNALPEPRTIKCSDLKDSTNGNDNAEQYEGLLVRVNGVNIVEGRGTDAWPNFVPNSNGFAISSRISSPRHGSWNSTGNYNITDASGYTAIMRAERGCGIGGLSTKPSGRYDVIGVVSQYDDPPFLTGYQVTPRSSADLIYIPQNLKAVADANGGVSLSWDASNDPDRDGYNIYRGEKQDLSDGSLIATLVKSATYYDAPSAGGIFFYAVTLHQSSGTNTLGYSTYIQPAQLESSFSNIVTNSPSAFASSGDKPVLSLSAKVFNPYHNAKLSITYNGRPDSIFAVRILDMKGRIVKIPVAAATWNFSEDSRTVQWAGDYPDGNKVPVGLYVIQVEETKAGGGSAHTEKIAAVGVRLR